MALRVNIGCGMTPTMGWRNFDNSLSIMLSRIPYFANVFYRLGFLNIEQYRFMKFACTNKIEYGDVVKGLPLADSSVEVIYSSHMLEHFDQNMANIFLREVYRILQPGGIIRLAVPDINKIVAKYIEFQNADMLIKETHLCVNNPKSFISKIRFLLVGPRNHKWMYDGRSLCRLLLKHGFVNTEILPVGKTNIIKPGPLDLRERYPESVYVEAEKPHN